MNLESAKSWANSRSKIYHDGTCFVVCKYNDEFVVQNLKFVIDHINEYSMDEIVYCTDEEKFEKLVTEHFVNG